MNFYVGRNDESGINVSIQFYLDNGLTWVNEHLEWKKEIENGK